MLKRVTFVGCAVLGVWLGTPARSATAAMTCDNAYDFKKDITFWPDSWKHNGSGTAPGEGYELELTTLWVEQVHNLDYDGKAENHEEYPCGGQG